MESDGTMTWDAERGWHVVTDEYGNIWDAVEVDGLHGILVREDSQRYYGAEWSGDDHRDTGRLYPRRDGDTYDGVDATYTFTEMGGWKDTTPAA